MLRSLRFTRRTATVTMSAPEASCAACMTWCVGYLPVPTISRERNSRPAMTNGRIHSISGGQELRDQTSDLRSPVDLSAADEIHDLDLVAVVDRGRGVGVALDDDEVAFDGDAARIDLEPREQVGDGQRCRRSSYGSPFSWMVIRDCPCRSGCQQRAAACVAAVGPHVRRQRRRSPDRGRRAPRRASTRS